MRNELKTLIAASVVFACGDSGGRDDAGGTGTLTPTSSATATMTATATDTVGASETAGPTGETPTMGTGSESNGTSPTDPTDGVTGTATNDTGPKFDLGIVPDGGMACSGGGGGGEPDFSYIWVANSGQGTMSKINTVNLVEEGRYIVRPDSAGNPSRTSVNLSGDVVIANRSGGLTKVYAQAERCADTNGMPGIQTAADANYLPWGVEECVAWYTPMSYISQRPVAWTQGNFNQATCQWENQKIWTSGNNDTFESADNQLDVLLVNGDNGAIEATVNVVGVNPDYYGIYGAAVDGDGNFWGSQLGIGQLVFIDRMTLQYKLWPMAMSGYGMTVDSKGFVWTCSSSGAARFDPMTETWQTLAVPGSGGCMEDGNGTLYMSGSGPTILAIDTMTMTQKDTLAIPSYVHGISIDFYGYVWGVTLQEPYAYRVEPLTKVVDTFTGLTAPYTYSDMTGFALSNAGSPSG
ncbi:hypothetical protein [Nannocystis sp. SCPEA4]|uniref:hypothetical protein n=1 Tax=Nannocystis sp. SCPEA4 TaxID=2996787 RepID=UPI00226E7693|nr:hypothetical protein [Nannocystis sp. SCPEA4]MCY1057220.1 hypothetical protein [Nannocystis sp. SCPEA4]